MKNEKQFLALRVGNGQICWHKYATCFPCIICAPVPHAFTGFSAQDMLVSLIAIVTEEPQTEAKNRLKPMNLCHIFAASEHKLHANGDLHCLPGWKILATFSHSVPGNPKAFILKSAPKPAHLACNQGPKQRHFPVRNCS